MNTHTFCHWVSLQKIVKPNTEFKPFSSVPLQVSYLFQDSSGTFQISLIPLYLLLVLILTVELLVSFCFSHISPVWRFGGFVASAASAPNTKVIFQFLSYHFECLRQDLLKDREDKNLNRVLFSDLLLLVSCFLFVSIIQTLLCNWNLQRKNVTYGRPANLLQNTGFVRTENN